MGNVEFDLYPKINLVHFQGSGEVSFAMIVEKIVMLHKHPEWRFDMNTLIDFEDCVVRPDVEGMEKYEEFFTGLQQSTPARKWAIYTKRTSTHRSANMSHLLSSRSIRVDVFQNLNDALDFLGVDHEVFGDLTCR